MPITLNHSNINIQYSSDKSYIIETVKSDLYRSNEFNINNIVTNNIQVAPVTPGIYIENSNIYAVESYTYTGSANTADYTRVFPKNTTSDILIVGGGGGGGYALGGGGGAGQLVFIHQATLNGTYTIKVGKGGTGGITATPEPTKGINSEFGTVIAEGGGANGGTLKDGGSGAGGDGYSTTGGTSGAGNKNTTIDTFSGATVYSRGNNGGNNGGTGGYFGGGGGGAGQIGTAGQDAIPYGKGGDGLSGISEINYDFKTKFGTNVGKTEGDGLVWFAAGGGGGGNFGGNGGKGGGGGGGSNNNTPGYNASNNTGSGGGGGGGNGNEVRGGNGGSGIVIIRYLLGTIPTTNYLTTEPTITTPVAFTETFRSFIHSGGAEAQTTHTITISRDTICDILVVGGGGGGGCRHAGGGGAGAVIYLTNQTFFSGTYTIRVGKGGNGASTMGQGNKGEDSSVSFNSTNIYLAKGGGAGHHDASSGNSNKDGGSGAGSGGGTIGYPVSTNIPAGIYGNTGGYLTTYEGGGGGGGGALTSGTNGTATVGGNGGAGISISITGTAVTYGGGGGGGSRTGYTPGTGGVGGGGNGSTTSTASSGTAGTGGGGGGGGFLDGSNGVGGAGGSGIVIIRLKSFAGPILEGITHKRLNFATSIINIPNSTTNMVSYRNNLGIIYSITITGVGNTSGNIWGTDIYTDDSYINKTAVHAGVILNGETKTVYIEMLPGQQSYTGTTRNTVVSANFAVWSGSYKFVQLPIYTLNFPVPTLADINNNSNIVLRGEYDIAFSTSNAVIIPKAGQYIIPPTTFTTSNLSLRYHLLNPILDPIGAQWTYSSNNTNVYHMGRVGIGTTNPEYQLDVRGFIFTSAGGYTQTGSENWVVQSDRRIKENIVKASYEKCLDNVKKIELYNFNFKDNCVNTNDKNQLGFIAQEVQQVYPKAVEVGRMTLDNNQGINDLLTLNTTQIKYTLYGAVKNLIERVENIESRVEQIYNMTLSSNIKSSSSNISITFITPLTPNITTNTSNITANTSNIKTNTSNI